MRKIPTLFQRDAEDRRHVTTEVTPGCEWVLSGEGVPTRKVDGTCVMLGTNGRWWARREVKPGKPAPAGFVISEHDGTTGKTVGWEPIESSPFVKFWREAAEGRDFDAGTYELCGPKINGNPEDCFAHTLVSHQHGTTIDPGKHNVGDYLAALTTAMHEGWEGIVWHHPDGRMAKLKVRDFPAA